METEPLKIDGITRTPDNPKAILVLFNRPITGNQINELRQLMENWMSFAIVEPTDEPT